MKRDDVGFQRIAGNSTTVIGLSGKPTAFYGIEIKCGNSSGAATMFDGTSSVKTSIFSLYGAANKVSPFSFSQGIMFPHGLVVTCDSNVTYAVIHYSHNTLTNIGYQSVSGTDPVAVGVEGRPCVLYGYVTAGNFLPPSTQIDFSDGTTGASDLVFSVDPGFLENIPADFQCGVTFPKGLVVKHNESLSTATVVFYRQEFS